MFNKTTQNFVLSTLSYETLQLSLTQPAHPSVFGNIKKGNIYVVGSCNGLVCLYARSLDEFEVVIWNPATRETKVVPKSNLPRLLPAGYKTIIDSIEFGFDAKTNDYKIINLLTPYDMLANSFTERIIQSEVYSLSADSWRKGDSPLCCSGELYTVGLNTYINGMASWAASNRSWDGILSFDMSDEVFLKTPLPDDVLDNCNLSKNGLGNCKRSFFLFKESIAMAVTTLVDYCICFDIWRLLEVGVKDSWTKLFTIGPFSEYIDRPLGFWKSSTMFLTKFNQLFLYNPFTNQMVDLQIRGGLRRLVTYKESLVSVQRGNEFEEQDDC
ncbi:F-box/kelch-repeat protein At3g06240-like [Corylus avellana]|uniref:F-box/kelch-repeat protein At3g06240-like n=1 Tax=Corylus avellana TaxID=13451 RepID=UPI001E237E11|nr:F-box/kelch-repeat protein At3g06240-like [Corylus avellana]